MSFLKLKDVLTDEQLEKVKDLTNGEVTEDDFCVEALEKAQNFIKLKEEEKEKKEFRETWDEFFKENSEKIPDWEEDE